MKNTSIEELEVESELLSKKIRQVIDDFRKENELTQFEVYVSPIFGSGFGSHREVLLGHSVSVKLLLTKETFA